MTIDSLLEMSRSAASRMHQITISNCKCAHNSDKNLPTFSHW